MQLTHMHEVPMEREEITYVVGLVRKDMTVLRTNLSKAAPREAFQIKCELDALMALEERLKIVSGYSSVENASASVIGTAE
jgi:hypothetical protein